MPYSPPSFNAVNFSNSAAYTPPAFNHVDFGIPSNVFSQTLVATVTTAAVSPKFAIAVGVLTAVGTLVSLRRAIASALTTVQPLLVSTNFNQAYQLLLTVAQPLLAKASLQARISLAVTVADLVSLTKSLTHALTVAQPTQATLRKLTLLAFTVAQASAATLTQARFFFKTLEASLTSLADMAKLPAKLSVVTVAASTSLSRRVAKAFTVSRNVVATLFPTRLFLKLLTATSHASATLNANRMFFVVLTTVQSLLTSVVTLFKLTPIVNRYGKIHFSNRPAADVEVVGNTGEPLSNNVGQTNNHTVDFVGNRTTFHDSV